MRGLGVADRQLLEIAKALSSSARLLIMDEPTAALSPNEVDNLFATVRRLRDRGVAVLYISHRLEEVAALADVVTVIRDGQHIATRPASELSQAEIIRLMVGRSLDQLFPKEEAELGDVVFRAEGLSRGGLFSDVSFELRRGEIVGLAGFVGAGRTEVARAIFGVDPLDAGQALDRGPVVQAALAASRAPARARLSARGPDPPGPDPADVDLAERDDGRAAGADAARVPAPARASSALTRRFMEQLRIKATSPAQVVRSLSGGNQQKVVLSKWLAAEPRILILDEPTHGVDVGTKADVHRTISHLATQGLTILLISSELPEILGMSDRVLVMREGRLVAEIARAEATQERVIAAAAGLGRWHDRAGLRALKPQQLAAAAFRLREIGIVIALARRDRLLRDPGAELPDGQQLAGHRQGRRDRRRRRGRRDDGRADAEHRPQRRLDGRPQRLPLRRLPRRPHRRAARR